jgi:primosomal protein N' (replication factor Y)
VADTSDSAEVVDEVVKVAIAVPLSQVFDYLPAGEISQYKTGVRVLVNFARRKVIGYVVGTGAPSVDVSKVKPVEQLLDSSPQVPADIIDLIKWAAGYYHHPLGEAWATALPVAMRKAEFSPPKEPVVYRPTEEGTSDCSALLKRAPSQAGLLDFLVQSPLPRSAAECRLHDTGWSAPMKQLIAKGLVETVRAGLPAELARDRVRHSPELNPQQASAAAAIKDNAHHYYAQLLYGVTGSGKTEVYIDAARPVIEAGKQVLILLPEIGLTPQLLSRIQSALACRVELSHSGLNDTERYLAWQAARSGEARILIGTRSAVFTPLPKLGLIVVDEEHDGSLKQQDGFRYHARDLAMVRARSANIPVVLASATPSLESLHNVVKGQLQMHKLENRAGSATGPELTLLDSRSAYTENGVSGELLKSMGEVLARGEQVIVFINRRGFAPVLMCEACGAITDCNHCDAHMTIHARSRSLRCHHCGASRSMPRACANCQSTDLLNVGVGTERVDEYLSEKFPDYKVLRIDRDTTSRKGELQRHLAMAASGEAQILVGTQMLAKGHDFPNVTLVGILDADQGLFSADFRSIEQMGQLIVQVAGRAGRAEKPGRVIVQSRSPEHPLLQTLLQQGYGSFTEQLLTERRDALWPPYMHIALLRSDSAVAGEAREFLQRVKDWLTNSLQERAEQITVMGPADAPMERLGGRHRAQLLLMAEQRKPLHQLLSVLRPALEKNPAARKVRWSIDVDPHDML